MKLPDSLRDQLKIPLGVLLPIGQDNKRNIQKYLSDDSFIITVGDRTTEKMIDFDLTPSLQIIDGFEKRIKRDIVKLGDAFELQIDNPAAEITLQSIEIIKKAFTMNPPIRLTVNGEEDLLVLPVCIHAPENSVILYGQPNKGLVLVQITAEIRNKAQALLDLMK
ncbi:MAG: GTP-dependent dephospho-CoA kinase family protein [Nitrosopumilus sp.]|nr:GTP-dependent dephospho-CoA kinase family protein [Nitrosopumilus sp.]MBT3925123.1 GTP-dependent dephospho-CoA kinase family protein [Nitrosopumilus sp.]MBT4216021.1 GTP-dependent dephospho-CoA kinase family protein [Nitrosopumilus sp.]MBT4550152.1 GTP-dependent dephospho-CoA kinase family protein [Nitrosopumilus sp.]MBT7474128.1 GTP-dependent dephospho-CoA kinase family protein [Nitrosopumilus sp.]